MEDDMVSTAGPRKTVRLQPSERHNARLHPLDVEKQVLASAYERALKDGYRAVTIEAVSEETGVAKTSIYRRWPNRAAMIAEAFLRHVTPAIVFPPTPSAMESIRLQMRALAKMFRGSEGALIRSLLAEAQYDPEVSAAFLDRWLYPRRQTAAITLQRAIDAGELREDLDVQVVLDALYGGIYYRLVTGFDRLSDSYIDKLFEHVMMGLSSRI
jgi:AcrR family transcriptional regulator